MERGRQGFGNRGFPESGGGNLELAAGEWPAVELARVEKERPVTVAADALDDFGDRFLDLRRDVGLGLHKPVEVAGWIFN